MSVDDGLIESNDILREVRYPDKVSGEASALPEDKVQYAWNRLGEPFTMTDQNQTVHAYARDVLGRPLADAVTTLGSGVDGLVRRLTTSYDVLGRPLSLSSFDAAEGGNPVNQVTRSYHALGPVAEEHQAVSGAVGPATPSVQYAYDATGRLTSLTYPNGRVIAYNYAGSDALLGRPSSLSDGAVTLEAYTQCCSLKNKS